MSEPTRRAPCARCHRPIDWEREYCTACEIAMDAEIDADEDEDDGDDFDRNRLDEWEDIT